MLSHFNVRVGPKINVYWEKSTHSTQHTQHFTSCYSTFIKHVRAMVSVQTLMESLSTCEAQVYEALLWSKHNLDHSQHT